MLRVPNIEECLDFARFVGAKKIIEVPIEPREHDIAFQCHKNCEINPILGYLIAKDSHGILHGYKHSVLDTGDRIVDVTPTLDDRKYNVFMYGNIPYTSEIITYIESSVFINKENKETEYMYYVYALIDPRNNQPFYIGKGKDDRALSHFKESSLNKEGNTRKTAKIKKLKELGYDPVIEFYAQNIEDEELAYTIESFYIKKYGRIGHEQNGILTNICENANPPNHKNKTYKEIYGDNAEHQRKIRHDNQLNAGGWFKGHKHTEESKRKTSEKTIGTNNPRYGVKLKGTDTAYKIGKSNTGKKHYSRAKLLYIDGLDIFIYSNDLKMFCKNNNLSHSTFLTQLAKDWPRSKKGKNTGLKIRTAIETEITSYIGGGVKKDVNNDSFKGFSL